MSSIMVPCKHFFNNIFGNSVTFFFVERQSVPPFLAQNNKRLACGAGGSSSSYPSDISKFLLF